MAVSASSQITIQRYRGDTVPDVYNILDDDDGNALDISTGYQFKMTLNSEKNPADDTNKLYSVTGTITNGPAGEVSFSPSTLQADQTPGTYYYDVQMIYPSGAIKTLEKGRYVYLQDITKS